MKAKLFNLLLLISSLFGYLEWGDQSAFLFESELEIIGKLFSDPRSIIHPFTVLPLFGQLILLITIFQKKPNKFLTFVGIGGLGILLLFMFFIGLISLHFKILISTLPFLLVAIMTINYYRKNKSVK